MATRKLDKPLKVARQEVSLSAFAFIFSELVQYSQARVSHAAELETRLSNAGAAVGGRILELIEFRERAGKRETRIVAILQFVAGALWKTMFGKTASLERSTEHDDEYMIGDPDPLVNKFISTPRELSHLNCASFMAGIIRGALDAAEFPCRVTAHFVPIEGTKLNKTILLIKFTSPATLAREKKPI